MLTRLLPLRLRIVSPFSDKGLIFRHKFKKQIALAASAYLSVEAWLIIIASLHFRLEMNCLFLILTFAKKNTMQFDPYNETQSSIRERVSAIHKVNLAEEEYDQALLIIMQCIDLTTLEGTDNEQRVTELCKLALSFKKTMNGNSVAAVCVYPPYVKTAKSVLIATGIQVATVACAFPSGQLPLHLKLEEVKYAVDQGADEIDMVISRGTFLAGDYNAIVDEVSQVKKACGVAHLKVILETGELKTVENIRKASELAIQGGADFLKTSTGKITPAATAEAVVVMLDTIKEYHKKTGLQIGLKPAGGIAEIEDALLYYKIVGAICGQAWLNNTLFRIGASRLAGKVHDALH
jgi:deoxyribose-phosphate aldolase